MELIIQAAVISLFIIIVANVLRNVIVDILFVRHIENLGDRLMRDKEFKIILSSLIYEQLFKDVDKIYVQEVDPAREQDS